MTIPVNITSEAVAFAIQQKKRNRIVLLFPEEGPLRRELYVKHSEFFAAGADFKERMFRAANRAGKSEAGAYESALHLTGDYPDWWVGKRFSRPVNGLVAGETGKLVRDSVQLKLFGEHSEFGTGLIPFDNIVSRRPKHGTPDAIDTAQIKHKSGGISTLQFQSYDQGRETFQATTRDFIWLDEEPPLAIYTECLTRTMTSQGIVFTTFTPLKGMSETVQFLMGKVQSGTVHMTTATWDDAPHLSKKDKEDLLESYPVHQRDARTKGIPALGSGAIYPVAESDIICEPFELPVYWRRGYGLDVGWNKTAAIFGAYDEDSDVLYLYSEHYRGQAEPSVHAEAIKARGYTMRGVIDPASRGRSQSDGKQLLEAYQTLGLQLSMANNGVETGIHEMYQRLSTGRMKVFSTLQNWLNEFRVYRRDMNGRVVKENDHLMDATRYLNISGINIMDFPPEYVQSLTHTPKHQFHYNPLDPKHIASDLPSQHKIDYNPLKGR